MDNLPRYFALESLFNDKYVRYVHEDVVLHGHVELSGEEVISLYTKFELEPAKNEGYTGLFNIRCCYNNRYWTRREESTGWITASAAEPVEDQFKWSCTLFEPSVKLSGNGKSVLTLRHVQHNRYVPVSIGSADPTYRSCLKADANHQDSNTTGCFYIIDWDSFVILPKLVVFKDDKGLTLCGYKNYFRFQSTSDVSLPLHSYEILYTRDGTIRVRVPSNNYFWYVRADSNVVSMLTGDMEPDDKKDLFWLVKSHGDNEVAIQGKVSQRFCQGVSANAANDLHNYLDASAFTMVEAAILRVEEPVVSRSVYNVNFRFENSRIYNQSDVIMARKLFSNSLDVDQVIHPIQTFTKDTTRTWNSSVTLKTRTPTTMETSIPSIVDGEVDVSDEFAGRYEWGTDMKGSETTEFSDHINIPPRSTVTVHVIATKGTCDVPFSYMQRDTLTDGKVLVVKKDDGVFTGINYYNFKAEVVKTIPNDENN